MGEHPLLQNHPPTEFQEVPAHALHSLLLTALLECLVGTLECRLPPHLGQVAESQQRRVPEGPARLVRPTSHALQSLQPRPSCCLHKTTVRLTYRCRPVPHLPPTPRQYTFLNNHDAIDKVLFYAAKLLNIPLVIK